MSSILRHRLEYYIVACVLLLLSCATQVRILCCCCWCCCCGLASILRQRLEQYCCCCCGFQTLSHRRKISALDQSTNLSVQIKDVQLFNGGFCFTPTELILWKVCRCALTAGCSCSRGSTTCPSIGTRWSWPWPR